MIRQLTLSTLAFAAIPFMAPPVNAMTLSEAKAEICDAAREYRQWGTYKQAVEEVYLYASYLASANGLGTPGRRALERKGIQCVW